MTVYLTVEQLVFINAEVLKGKPQLRDQGLLESALARPQASAFAQDAYPTIYESQLRFYNLYALITHF